MSIAPMASLKIDKKKNDYYVTVVESYRDPVSGQPKTKTIANLGKVEPSTLNSFKRMGERLLTLCGLSQEQIQSRGIKEVGRYNYGYVMVVKSLLSYFGLDAVFTRSMKRNKLSFNLLECVILMLCERLNDPRSKRANYFSQHEYLGLPPLALHHLYRSLEYLAKDSKLIQQQIYQSGRDLFNQRLDVVFYDVTTFYFDSQVEQKDALRQKGFSKDGKIGNTQVVMGLLIDELKRPVCYQLYSGDTWEGGTFIDIIGALKKEYSISKVIIVADRGMINKTNLKAVEDNGYEFIIGERLKVLPQQVKHHLLNKANYTRNWIANQDKNLMVSYTQIQHEDRTIIGTWSAKRAEKDAHERTERKERGEYLLNHPTDIGKKAKHYYLKEVEGKKGQWQKDESRIKEAEKYDGFLAIATNIKQMPAEQVLNHYKHLYQVEHSFRTFKTFLETRPMFHWNDERIKGHMCLCYIAYSILNQIQIGLDARKQPLSENQIRKALDHMQVSLVKQGKEEFYIRSKEDENVDKISNSLKIKQLPEMLHKSQIVNHL